MLKTFNSHGTDSELTKYDNCLCEVQRELTKEEADIVYLHHQYLLLPLLVLSELTKEEADIDDVGIQYK